MDVGTGVSVIVLVGMAYTVCVDAAFAVCAMIWLICAGSNAGAEDGAGASDGAQAITSTKAITYNRNFDLRFNMVSEDSIPVIAQR